MTLLIYIIKTIFISGALLSYYWFFLRNRSFHAFNRYFLLSIPILSLLIPAFHFAPPQFWNQSASDSPVHLLGVARGTWEEAVTVYASRKKGIMISWESVFGTISICISIYLSVGLIRSIQYLAGLKKQNPRIHLPGVALYLVSEKGTPFSFFKSIFWAREMELDNIEGRQILRHELFHVQQKHSFDTLYMECSSILMWFNPFLHIIRFELKAIHEYAADAHALSATNEYDYAKLLLMHISGSSVALAHPFFKNQIKRRIAMITKNNKNKKARFGRFMILPLIVTLICLFSFKLQRNLSFGSSPTLRVVIDPGHGGIFNGTTYNGIYEKNINLSIAKKIQALARDYQVEVIMTRETDDDHTGNNLDASLNYRAGLAEAKKADLFISIHVNGRAQKGPQNTYSGFEIYVPDNTNKFHAGSVKLASSITNFIRPDYTISPELKERDGNIRILAQASVPAILIECGYIDNPADLTWMQDEKNQEKIARDILEGIQKYGAYAIYNDAIPQGNQAINKNLVLTVHAVAAQSLQVNQADQVGEVKQINRADQTKELSKQVEQVDAWEQDIKTDSSAPLRKVEVEAEYPGSAQAWIKYLTKTLKYPDEAVNNEVQGSVIVEFVVNEDGSLTDIHAISGPTELRKESIRVITESGKWVPARDWGAIVASYHKQPINFKLETK